MRSFNTTGPCVPEWHYTLDPVARLADATRLIDKRGYFVVHAPRQTGKTTTLLALARALTAEGRYAALHFSCEIGQAAGDDYDAVEAMVLDEVRRRAHSALPPDLRPPESWPEAPPGARVSASLETWARICPRPRILFFDEIDALQGSSLQSILRQLRSGFPNRPRGFPASVVLCGLRDVRDYKAASGGDARRLGTSSPFNVKVKSLRLSSFSEADLRALYGQHTEETGQEFTEDALARAWELTAGQPWLTNAVAREITEEMAIPPPTPITVAHMDEAKERLVLERATHLDSLVARLHEPRVRRFIAPALAGTLGDFDRAYNDDLSYVRDLGLVAPDNPVRPANPIYREVIARVLASPVEGQIEIAPPSFVCADGTLDVRRILDEFAAFWTEHGDILAGRLPYNEAGAQLVLMAYLQRIVNGGGYVDREFGVGRGRIDLVVRWPHDDERGVRVWQRIAMELKVWAPGRPDPLARGLLQLDDYLRRLGLDEGVLVLFDRREEAGDVEARTRFEETRTASGRAVRVLRA